MKKFICCICICMLLAGSASAYVSPSMIERAGEIKTELQNGGNTEQLVGETTILMLENDVLNELTENGEDEYAADLKSSADAALDASATGSDNAQTLAIDFADKLAAVPLDTFYTTGDGEYIPVQELEHYALKVDNSTAADELVTVSVEFYKSDYTAAEMTGYKYNDKNVGTYSSLSRSIKGEDNIFNFTTPKGCTYVKVTDDSADLSLPLAIEITNEVINNGSVNFAGGTTATTRFPGWSIGSYYSESFTDCFAWIAKTSTNVYQFVTLKEGSTYRLRFKFAQSEKNSATLSYEYPRLYFQYANSTYDGLPVVLGTSFPKSWKNVEPLDSAPTASQWEEYEIYFTAGQNTSASVVAPGLCQTQIVPRGYNTVDAVSYYDDFSLEEVDEGSYIGYISTNTSSSDKTDVRTIGVSGKSLAKQIRYHYTQKTAGQTQKLINVKYDNGAISSVDVIEVGKDLTVGASANYDITIDTDTSKIFLWDGTTLVPQRLPIEDYVITD